MVGVLVATGVLVADGSATDCVVSVKKLSAAISTLKVVPTSATSALRARFSEEPVWYQRKLPTEPNPFNVPLTVIAACVLLCPTIVSWPDVLSVNATANKPGSAENASIRVQPAGT